MEGKAEPAPRNTAGLWSPLDFGTAAWGRLPVTNLGNHEAMAGLPDAIAWTRRLPWALPGPASSHLAHGCDVTRHERTTECLIFLVKKSSGPAASWFSKLERSLAKPTEPSSPLMVKRLCLRR